MLGTHFQTRKKPADDGPVPLKPSKRVRVVHDDSAPTDPVLPSPPPPPPPANEPVASGLRADTPSVASPARGKQQQPISRHFPPLPARRGGGAALVRAVMEQEAAEDVDTVDMSVLQGTRRGVVVPRGDGTPRRAVPPVTSAAAVAAAPASPSRTPRAPGPDAVRKPSEVLPAHLERLVRVMEHIDASVRAGPRGVPMALSAVLAKPGVGGVAVSVEDVENILSMWPEAYIVTEPSKQAPLAKSSASAAAALPSAKAPSMSGFVIALPMAAMTSRPSAASGRPGGSSGAGDGESGPSRASGSDDIDSARAAGLRKRCRELIDRAHRDFLTSIGALPPRGNALHENFIVSLVWPVRQSLSHWAAMHRRGGIQHGGAPGADDGAIALPVPMSAEAKAVFAAKALSRGDLPERFKHLVRVSKALDVQLAMRRKDATRDFDKLRSEIELNVKHDVEDRHLAQIVGLFPGAFVITGHYGGSEASRAGAAFAGFLGREAATKWTYRVDWPASGSEWAVSVEQRRDRFDVVAREYVTAKHGEFLRVHRHVAPPSGWHPRFKLEDVLPPLAELPQRPARPSVGGSGLWPQMSDGGTDAAISRSVSQSTRVATVAGSGGVGGGVGGGGGGGGSSSGSGGAHESAAPALDSIVIRGLEGLPEHLVRKVAALEAQAKARAAPAVVAAVQDAAAMQLMLRLVNVLRGVFMTAKRTSLPLEEIADKVLSSCERGTFVDKGASRAPRAVVVHA
jgi:uncharacterized membrane protein YgcG